MSVQVNQANHELVGLRARTHLAGADMMTFFAPPGRSRCWLADGVVSILPVASMMYSAPAPAQSSLVGSRSEKRRMRRPRNTRHSLSSSSVRSSACFKRPCVES